MQTGKLELYQVMANGKRAIRVVVRGNVGNDGRAVLDNLGMTPVVNMANCREIITTTPEQLDSIRDALVASGVVDRNQPRT